MAEPCNEVLPQSTTLKPELINCCFLSERGVIAAVREMDTVCLGKCSMAPSDMTCVREETSGLQTPGSEKGWERDPINTGLWCFLPSEFLPDL